METKYFFTKDFNIKVVAYPIVKTNSEDLQLYDIYINGGCVALSASIMVYNELFKILN